MDGQSSKKRRKKYFQGGGNSGPKKGRRNRLGPGVKGFVVTCSNKDESRCVRESYNLLNEYADRLAEQRSNEQTVDKSSQRVDENEDLEQALKKERDALLGDAKADSSNIGASGSSPQRFMALETGVHNVVFIEATSADLDPCELVKFILSDAKKTGTCQSRFIQRILPVEITCKAYADDIAASLVNQKDLLSKHFSSNEFDGGPPSYAIFFKCRNNDNLTREEVYRVVGELISATNPLVKVDLEKPKKAVLVEVLQTVACISIVDDYMELAKYNLHLVAQSANK